MKRLRPSALCLWIMLTGMVQATDDTVLTTLKMESVPFKESPLYCEEKIVGPKDNDFEVLDYELMSSDAGLRYAFMSIRNNSNGQRFLSEADLVAIFANCQAKSPHAFKLKLSGGQIITKTIFFGQNQFPIVKIVTDENDI